MSFFTYALRLALRFFCLYVFLLLPLVFFTMGVGGKVQGTRTCCWWKGKTTAGSTGIQGTKPKAGGCGTELWTWCRSYPPRFPFPCAALRMVTNGSPDLCAIRYRPSSNPVSFFSRWWSIFNDLESLNPQEMFCFQSSGSFRSRATFDVCALMCATESWRQGERQTERTTRASVHIKSFTSSSVLCLVLTK